MKTLAFVVSLLVCFVASAEGDERRVDRSGAFEYHLPDGWKLVEFRRGPHDLLVRTSLDSFNRNLSFNDQPGKSSFPELKALYERDLARALKGFKLVSSEIVDLKGAGSVIRIIDTNTHPGTAVRQINYIVALEEKRYFIACTVPAIDGDRYDAEVQQLVESLRAK